MKATTATNWLGALVFAAVLFAVIHQTEQADDLATRAASTNAELAATDARMQRAAAALCQAELGPGAEVLWTREGELVCRPAVMTAQAGGVR